jgi:hypothetical protein
MKRFYSLFLLSLTASPLACSSSDTTVADSAEPVTEVEVAEACIDYCRRVAACDASIDERACADACDSIADHAKTEQCEATLHAALECIDEHFCQFGYPSLIDPEIEPYTQNPCKMKAAAVSCVVTTPAELEPAFGFFGTGFGVSVFGSKWAQNDGDRSCRTGSGGGSDEGALDVKCVHVDDSYVCSCLIDDRVTATFETDEQVCPIGDSTSQPELYGSCGFRY